MEIVEFKEIIGIWVLFQLFTIPFIITDENKTDMFAVNFIALVMLIIIYFGLKLIGA